MFETCKIQKTKYTSQFKHVSWKIKKKDILKEQNCE